MLALQIYLARRQMEAAIARAIRGVPNESLGKVRHKSLPGIFRQPPGQPPEAAEGRPRSKFFLSQMVPFDLSFDPKWFLTP